LEDDPVALAKLEQRTTPDTVADTLREAILDGTLPTGAKLRETQISAELGISRAPLREAFRRLEEEGLVLKVPFVGAFVAEISESSINDIARLRAVLEPWAVREGWDTLQSEKLPYLQSLIDRLDAAAHEHNMQEGIAAHLAFHRTIYESAGNEALVNLWRGWENQLRLFLAADYRAYADDPMWTHHAHAKLLETIVKGDLRGAQKEIATHIHGAATESNDGSRQKSTKTTGRSSVIPLDPIVRSEVPAEKRVTQRRKADRNPKSSTARR
jgi:DNA-binding GntR family transcriptional regulator